MQVKLHHKPNAAVYLLGGTHRSLALVIGESFRLGHFHPVGQPGVPLPQGLVSEQLRPVHPHNHIGAQVLNGLEPGNGPAKGDAVLGVFNGHFRVLARRPDNLRAEQGRAGVQHLQSRRPPPIDFADDIAQRRSHPVHSHLALRILGQRGQPRLGNAGRRRRHDDQGNARVIAGRRRRAHRHHHQLGGREIVHKVLDAGDDQAVAVHFAPALDGVRPQAGILLLRRPGHNQIAPRHPGQNGLFLPSGAMTGHRQRGRGAAVEGNGRDGPPAFLQNQAQVGNRQPAAAISFRQRNAEPAQGRHLLPQLHRIAPLILLNGAGQAGWTFRLQKLAGGIFDHQFFFGG